MGARSVPPAAEVAFTATAVQFVFFNAKLNVSFEGDVWKARGVEHEFTQILSESANHLQLLNFGTTMPTHAPKSSIRDSPLSPKNLLRNV